jgi:predicted porin
MPSALLAQETAVDEHGSETDVVAADKERKRKEVRDREIGADEDPLLKERAEVIEERVEGVVKRARAQLYGSIRIRYRKVDSETVWSDGGSRIGLSGSQQLTPGLRLIGRGEAGFNLLDQAEFLLNRGSRPPEQSFGDTFFLRLLYAGISTERATITFGKNWSTFYQVTSFTDRFQGTGASASGTYNAGTDGGNTGTGRADRVLQGRGFAGPLQRELLGHPLGLNIQVQHEEPIPLTDGKFYGTTVGLSTVYEAKSNWSIGVAYNHANINDADVEALRSIGIDGDATALAIGARWYGEDWYVGTVVSRLENHEATDQSIYFHGTGWEVYSQYKLAGPWWAIAGWNRLEPDADQAQAGAFKIDYGVLGIRYVFEAMRKMVFLNIRFESSVSQGGLPGRNVYTIGVRWDLP